MRNLLPANANGRERCPSPDRFSKSADSEKSFSRGYRLCRWFPGAPPTRMLPLCTLHSLLRLRPDSSCVDAVPGTSEAAEAPFPVPSLVLAPGDEFTTARDIGLLGVRPNVGATRGTPAGRAEAKMVPGCSAAGCWFSG